MILGFDNHKTFNINYQNKKVLFPSRQFTPKELKPIGRRYHWVIEALRDWVAEALRSREGKQIGFNYQNKKALFPSHQLIPKEFKPIGRRFYWVIEALRSTEGKQIGFIVLEPEKDQMPNYGRISFHMSINLEMALVFEKRMEAEEKLKESEKKLEKKVKIRTKELEEALEQQKYYLDQLLKSSELKSEFMASMSHDVRTPLNSIIGFTELLLEGSFGPLNDEQLSVGSDISTSGLHLLEMISNI